jgi:O-methyltransferase
MAWKTAVNKALTRTVGYKIVRAGAVPASRATAPTYPVDWDEVAKPILRAANPYTMTRAEKRYALYLATRYITRYAIPGAVVECGVWRGGSMHVVARTLLSIGDPNRELYLFDTFEGMTPPTDKDVTYDGRAVADLLAQRPKTSKIWAIASLEDVQEGMATVGYPAERIHYVKGPVEQTLPDAAPEQTALLRLDTDWYESTRHELHTLYDRLAPGGVLIVDDYGSYQGSRQAVDEFIEETGARLLLVPIGPGRIAVKP